MVALCDDIRKDQDGVSRMIADHQLDAVVDWVTFTPVHTEQDATLFTDQTWQFIFISLAIVY
ncbi:MAG: hypothetical protein KatS3mg052_1406 [Candidatus Roseilinea sp.]|nr:MAG: hypothetical protein KatS3mg052_1406 [Candidatus Roseilinea sp.]